MIYQIKYSYQTGDSFGSHDAEEVLELEWENLEVVKANLKRIEEHYAFYRELNNYYGRSKKSKEKILEENSSKDWFPSKACYDFSLKLYTDEGTVWEIYAPWCGYFEQLHSVEVILKQEHENLKITF